jgi:hypothetical protein
MGQEKSTIAYTNWLENMMSLHAMNICFFHWYCLP